MATKADNTGAFRRYVVEFIGTFFFLVAICMSVQQGLGQFAPVAIGVMLMVMVYAGGPISGGHYNPAVSLAAYLRGALHISDLLPYIVAQVLGGTLASMLAGFLITSIGGAEPTPKELDVVPSLIGEFLGTFALVYVILNVATSKRSAGNSYFGISIGFTVMTCAYIFGGISGGAFNPAVALGITMAGLTSWASIWIFIVANFVAGALAAFLFQYVNGPEA
ncbi:MAG TPA: aquaporin [Saprospiraceae bacterium]|nr:aquaporin [Saprospiraceae bacterium]